VLTIFVAEDCPTFMSRPLELEGKPIPVKVMGIPPYMLPVLGVIELTCKGKVIGTTTLPV